MQSGECNYGDRIQNMIILMKLKWTIKWIFLHIIVSSYQVADVYIRSWIQYSVYVLVQEDSKWEVIYLRKTFILSCGLFI
jgi:hypothetical protein